MFDFEALTNDSQGPSGIDAPSNPIVNRSSLQQLLLNDCLSHILLILGCFKVAVSIQYTQGFGVVETITAAGFENITPLRGPHFFTTNLILTCKEFHNTPITASNLCGKLATRLKYF